jgi:hypothetical protein
MDDENPPIVSSRALLVHLIGELHSLKEASEQHASELHALRRAHEEQTKSMKRHRVLAVLVAVMEWRATLIAGSAVAAAYFTKWPWFWPWRK